MLLARREAGEWAAMRAAVRPRDTVERVAGIIESVRLEGDRALRRWSLEWDGVAPDPLRVPRSRLEQALDALPGILRQSLETAIAQVRAFHEGERTPAEAAPPMRHGVMARVLRTPLDRVLVYVPAGRAPLPSSVVMGVVPAQVAGVESIGLLTPPGPSGEGDSTTLAAAALLGIDEVYLVGGAQAIAAAAYGTETIPRASKIVGPGNRWVTEAKRQVLGVIGIDGLNGPSEVVVWADPPASPTQAAQDVLAQAEHDVDSWAILLSTDLPWLGEAEREACRLAATAGREDLLARPYVGSVHLAQSAEAARFINQLAPEHVELWGAAESWEPSVVGGAATFVGCPVPLGDYAAGPNHVLPTGGTARFASVLGVDDFRRRRTVNRLVGPADPVLAAAAALAEAEGLLMHRDAVTTFASGREAAHHAAR